MKDNCGREKTQNHARNCFALFRLAQNVGCFANFPRQSQVKAMKLKDWREVLTLDFPSNQPITRNTVKMTLKEGNRFRGSMRISTGRIWTDHEFENYRKKVLNTPLP